MAVKIVLILLLFSVSLGHAQKTVELECQSAVGVVGENTKIPCSFKFSSGLEDVTINEAMSKKKGQTDPVLNINFLDPAVNEDPRVRLPSRTDPSLLFTNITVSDEGEYEYQLDTSRGVIRDGVFSLRVTAEYDPPVINSVPEEIKDGDGVELYCSTSGGYPAGGIHWFDSTGANWTERATLEITKRDDRLLTMSSKLNLNVTDLSLESFRCVVLNSSFSEVGETSFGQRRIGGPHSSPHPALIVAGVLVPVLILAPVVIISYFRRRKMGAREPAAGGGADADGTVTPLKKE
ncbi:CD276 antigen homolog isoform X3 [Hoplias malabaricus]|uniref:CD276 antigen homolog isoform X3 n=1 Tax=Hoplias malabaricus TaxID=27720 RepID=UPI003461E563